MTTQALILISYLMTISVLSHLMRKRGVGHSSGIACAVKLTTNTYVTNALNQYASM